MARGQTGETRTTHQLKLDKTYSYSVTDYPKTNLQVSSVNLTAPSVA